jgi:hypothetical protein
MLVVCLLGKLSCLFASFKLQSQIAKCNVKPGLVRMRTLLLVFLLRKARVNHFLITAIWWLPLMLCMWPLRHVLVELRSMFNCVQVSATVVVKEAIWWFRNCVPSVQIVHFLTFLISCVMKMVLLLVLTNFSQQVLTWQLAISKLKLCL